MARPTELKLFDGQHPMVRSSVCPSDVVRLLLIRPSEGMLRLLLQRFFELRGVSSGLESVHKPAHSFTWDQALAPFRVSRFVHLKASKLQLLQLLPYPLRKKTDLLLG